MLRAHATSTTLKNGSHRSPIARRARGAVMVEYAFLLVAVGIPAMTGLAVGGKRMYDNYIDARSHILAPFP